MADFNLDGSTGILSAGFVNGVGGPIFSSPALAEVRYEFRYRFDVTTLSRFLGDWTVSFPQDVTIALEGPSDLSGPLPGAFGHHSALLPAGSYELSFSARGTPPTVFAQTGYSVFTIGGGTKTVGFDIYSFQIIDAPASSVPEPASWALAALAIGVCCIGARRRTGPSPARLY